MEKERLIRNCCQSSVVLVVKGGVAREVKPRPLCLSTSSQVMVCVYMCVCVCGDVYLVTR